jgi:hypothetical protein
MEGNAKAAGAGLEKPLMIPERVMADIVSAGTTAVLISPSKNMPLFPYQQPLTSFKLYV